jgi:hypothetical protein
MVNFAVPRITMLTPLVPLVAVGLLMHVHVGQLIVPPVMFTSPEKKYTPGLNINVLVPFRVSLLYAPGDILLQLLQFVFDVVELNDFEFSTLSGFVAGGIK